MPNHPILFYGVWNFIGNLLLDLALFTLVE